MNNTKSFSIGPQANQSSYTDPFTGGSRYVPGVSTSNETSDVRGAADPFTGKYIFLQACLHLQFLLRFSSSGACEWVDELWIVVIDDSSYKLNFDLGKKNKIHHHS
jgi:hypothetical protein